MPSDKESPKTYTLEDVLRFGDHLKEHLNSAIKDLSDRLEHEKKTIKSLQDYDTKLARGAAYAVMMTGVLSFFQILSWFGLTPTKISSWVKSIATYASSFIDQITLVF